MTGVWLRSNVNSIVRPGSSVPREKRRVNVTLTEHHLKYRNKFDKINYRYQGTVPISPYLLSTVYVLF